ncbi:MAG: FAD binding domain-containing protein [Oligoflexia bacterium]
MRGNLPAFEMKAPRSLHEALALLAKNPGEWRPFAGGTDLMVLIESGHLAPAKFVSLWGLPGMNAIEVTPHEVAIGALATYTDVIENSVLRAEFPNLCEAARETGAVAIQNRGTIGGNIANASPAADTPPSLLVYGARVELLSSSGMRVVPYDKFHTGYKKTVMRSDEIIHRVLLDRSTSGLTHYYRKVGTRKAQAISKVCFSGVLLKTGSAGTGPKIADVRIALGSVSATPMRAHKTEASLRGRVIDSSLLDTAKAELAREISPIDDIRSNREYRLRVAQNLLGEFLCR